MRPCRLRARRSEMGTYNWGMIGCGWIGSEMAQAMQTDGRCLYAVASRSAAKAKAFAEQYGIRHCFETPGELLASPEIDIVYIATPHNTHSEYIERALASGKHVLCEKAITLNATELERAMELAEQKSLVLAEAMTIYHMPLYRKLAELQASGELGALRMVQVNFGSYKEYDMENRFFSPKLAGGAMLDIGTYALSFMRWFMASNPNEVTSIGQMAPSGVDEASGIVLRNPDCELATIALTLHARQPKRGMAAFDKGYMEVYDFPRATRATITFTKDGRREVVDAGNSADALRYEIRDMEVAVSGGPNTMHLAYTAGVLSIMTDIRRSWGLYYPEERA